MARPKKLKSDLRLHQINIRLTDSELEYAVSQSEIAGLSIADYLRTAAFRAKELRVKVNPVNRLLYLELNRVGVNINQLVRKVNSNQYPKIHKELIELKSLLVKISEEVCK